ncbi:MAG: hypothetical protein IPQ12_10220 [Polaromonas sp.]|nr:hypothetical protein [Polaromonas sp.]
MLWANAEAVGQHSQQPHHSACYMVLDTGTVAENLKPHTRNVADDFESVWC